MARLHSCVFAHRSPRRSLLGLRAACLVDAPAMHNCADPMRWSMVKLAANRSGVEHALALALRAQPCR
jgi:hypothetical protein